MRYAAMLLSSFVLLSFVSGCTGGSGKTADDYFVIIHTNDLHAHYEAYDATEAPCNPGRQAIEPCSGGAPRLASAIKEARKSYPNALLLDAGDQFQGSLLFQQFGHNVSTRVANRLRYDAMAIGNHEFDSGIEALEDFIQSVNFPVLSANIRCKRSCKLDELRYPYITRYVGGRQAAIIGLTTPDVIESAGMGEKLTVLDPAAVLRELIPAIEADGISSIVLLSHLGIEESMSLAADVSGVDIIVDGHSHTLLSNSQPQAWGPYPVVVDSPTGEPVLIVSTGAFGKELGLLKVRFDEAGVLIEWSGDTTPLDQTIAEDAGMKALLSPFVKATQSFYSDPIAVAEVPVDGSWESCRFYECLMGNLTADALLSAAATRGAEAAFLNSGAVRGGFSAGPISYGDILGALPYENTLITFKVSGQLLHDMLEHSLSRADNESRGGTGRFLQVSGLHFSWNPSNPEGQRVNQVFVVDERGNYQPLDLAAKYHLASIDYLLEGDGYDAFFSQAEDVYDNAQLLSQIFRDYLAAYSTVAPQLEGRITRD